MIAIMPTLYLVMLIVWGAIFLLSLIVEVSTDGLVSIWFTVGAFVALILALFPQIPFWVPIIAFAVTSLIVFLLFFFFWRDKIRGVKKARLNANAAVGKTFVLLEAMEQKNGSKDRYFQGDTKDVKKLVPEGIAGRVPYKGTVQEVVISTGSDAV